MNKKKKVICQAFCTTILLFTICSQFVLPQMTIQEKTFDGEKKKSNKIGILKGEVNFENTKNKFKVQIEIKGHKVIKQVWTNDKGEFEVRLPIGYYNISILEQPTYFSYKRSSFVIQENKETIINILVPSKLGERLTMNTLEKGMYDEYPKNIKPKYERIFLKNCNANLDFLIRYENKRKEKNFFEYENVMLSYNIYNIYADKIKLMDKQVESKFSRIFVERGNQKLISDELILKFEKKFELEILTEKREKIVFKEVCFQDRN